MGINLTKTELQLLIECIEGNSNFFAGITSDEIKKIKYFNEMVLVDELRNFKRYMTDVHIRLRSGLEEILPKVVENALENDPNQSRLQELYKDKIEPNVTDRVRWSQLKINNKGKKDGGN